MHNLWHEYNDFPMPLSQLHNQQVSHKQNWNLAKLIEKSIDTLVSVIINVTFKEERDVNKKCDS